MDHVHFAPVHRPKDDSGYMQLKGVTPERGGCLDSVATHSLARLTFALGAGSWQPSLQMTLMHWRTQISGV